jgi:hypothetical protein
MNAGEESISDIPCLSITTQQPFKILFTLTVYNGLLILVSRDMFQVMRSHHQAEIH